ncbi:hypothetical protein T440DRAFT_39981 [Plenodomus tracheiphilus IPT5]|uniref:Uncharacterized protein n=1 Tax=Plenodomus tracheiphilus IPT5 TaxID=1408161 RepID=A0A6A7BAP7_9PLEO|nr:hypothetical protein T440DRAFT_39981 [Plenodomus tracheiphilus IPT5]
MRRKQELRINSFLTKNPEVIVAPLSIRKTTPVILDTTDLHTTTTQPQTPVGEHQHATTQIFRIHRKPVATIGTSSAPPRIGRPTSGSAINSDWFDNTLDAVLSASTTEVSFVNSVATVPRTSMDSVSTANERNTRTRPCPTTDIAPSTHPSCLQPGVITTSPSPIPNTVVSQYLVPPQDRPVSPRDQNINQHLQIHQLRTDGASIPPYDYFVHGRPLIETIFMWRDKLHGFRKL